MRSTKWSLDSSGAHARAWTFKDKSGNAVVLAGVVVIDPAIHGFVATLSCGDVIARVESKGLAQAMTACEQAARMAHGLRTMPGSDNEKKKYCDEDEEDCSDD